ncbi:MAG: hypothetical protein JWN68_418 [Nocardioides sp.]|jgi:hypothetical protein|uniref:hypothetical protein n=1 Tax=Nocardioides sp. TaxID=35761 RepID=UPI00263035D5|nr:hypothetical protein [Nocardioides sp.]MCW2832465.1 hypothetical protein [Nocardioides sp.]
MSNTTGYRSGSPVSTPGWRRVFRGANGTPPVVSIPKPRSHGEWSTPRPATTSGKLDWDGADVVYSRPNGGRAAATYSKPGAAPLTVTLGCAYTGNMSPGAEFVANGNSNFTFRSQVAGLDTGGVCLEQSTTSWDAEGSQDRGIYTFTFSRTVTNLSFTIADIEGHVGDSWDAVLPSPGYAVVSKTPDIVEQPDPNFGDALVFSHSGSDNAVSEETGSGGNLTLSYAGPLTFVSLMLWNGAESFAGTVDTDQRLVVSDLTFDFAP